MRKPVPMLGNPAHKNPWEVRSDSGLEGVFADEDDARFYAEEIRGSGASGVVVEIRKRPLHPRLQPQAQNPSSRLFAGVYPEGIVYADKARERDGDYLRVAFLPYSTLQLEWSPGVHPRDLREEIEQDAAKIIARRGQDFPVDASGHTVRLGGKRNPAMQSIYLRKEKNGWHVRAEYPGGKDMDYGPFATKERGMRMREAIIESDLQRNPTPPAPGWGTGEKRWRVWFSEAPDSYVTVTAGGYMEAMRMAAPSFKGAHDGETREMIAQRDGGRAIESLVTIHHGGRLTFHPSPSRGNPAGLTAKGERMYQSIKAGYGDDPRAAEIASRTVLARARTTRGLKKR